MTDNQADFYDDDHELDDDDDDIGSDDRFIADEQTMKLQQNPVLASSSPSQQQQKYQHKQKQQHFMMPTKRALEQLGRQDIIRMIESAGGFLEVAQSLGYKSTRRPPGYWEDSEALDRELSLFVAANWVQFEEGSSGNHDNDSNLLREKDQPSVSPATDHMRSDPQDLSFSFAAHAAEHSLSDNDDAIDGDNDASMPRANTHEVYWYNQVTRRVQWSEPVMPEAIPLDDEGSELFADSYDDRAMPSRNSVLAAGRYDLHAAIVAAGGYVRVAEELKRWPAWPLTLVCYCGVYGIFYGCVYIHQYIYITCSI